MLYQNFACVCFGEARTAPLQVGVNSLPKTPQTSSIYTWTLSPAQEWGTAMTFAQVQCLPVKPHSPEPWKWLCKLFIQVPCTLRILLLWDIQLALGLECSEAYHQNGKLTIVLVLLQLDVVMRIFRGFRWSQIDFRWCPVGEHLTIMFSVRAVITSSIWTMVKWLRLVAHA